MINLAARLHTAIKAEDIPIVGVSIGDAANKATWKVSPQNLQAAAQPTIDAFDVNDPTHAAIELATLALTTSRQKDILAMLAVIVRQKNVSAWNGMTAAQKVTAVLAEADLFKSFREFIDNKV